MLHLRASTQLAAVVSSLDRSPLIPLGVWVRANGGSLSVFTVDSFCAGHRQKSLPVVMLCQAEKQIALCAHPVLQGW